MERITLIGMYNVDDTLFSGLTVPEGIEEETCINTILMRCGECSVIYPSIDFMKFSIGVWSKKWYDEIERILRALTEDYNPIWNYDRYEDWLDNNNEDRSEINTRDIDATTKTDTDSSIDSKKTGTGQGTNQSEHKVSAYNESTYSPSSSDIGTSHDSRTETENSTNETTEKITSDSTDKFNSSGNTKQENKRTGRAWGNIGVTTSMQMIVEEVSNRQKFNVYDIIAEMFFKEFCIAVY